MTLYAVAPLGEFTTATPFVSVNINLKDADNNIIDISTMGFPTVSFDITGNVTAGNGVPLLHLGNEGSGLASVALASLLSAVKTWAEGMDWNTGITWSWYGVSATPVSFDSVSMVQGQTITSMTDVTPA